MKTQEVQFGGNNYPCRVVEIECVCVSVIGSGGFVIALCGGKVKEFLSSTRGYQFQCFYIRFLCFPVADRFDAAIPLQAVISEERLTIAYINR